MGLKERLAYLKQQASYKPPKKWYQKWWKVFFVLLGLLIGSYLVGTGIYTYKLAQEIRTSGWKKEMLAQAEKDKLLIEGVNNPWLGTSTPIITIVEFADFACPFCRNSYTTVRTLGALYGDKIKIIYRDFLGHTEAFDLALAARCAGEQDKFWAMHDKLFIMQTEAPVNKLPELAKQIGLNVEKFNKCLSEKKYGVYIKQDVDDAKSLGIAGTPTWYINGYQIKGEVPEATFINLIEQILKSYETN